MLLITPPSARLLSVKVQIFQEKIDIIPKDGVIFAEKEVTFYDLRTNMEGFGKTRPLRHSDFDEFVEGYNDSIKRTGERWSKFTREEIETKYGDSLDLGLIKDDSIIDADELPDPIESGEEAIAQLEEAVDLLKSVVRELKALSSEE